MPLFHPVGSFFHGNGVVAFTWGVKRRHDCRHYGFHANSLIAPPPHNLPVLPSVECRRRS